MSLPEVQEIRKRIESCEQTDIRMYLKAASAASAVTSSVVMMQ